ncbi:MAG: hypothetical protein NTZ17_07150 [Phycisphaerae bacterium]|nr:hypothetical protein [Phycisphaerae bacterium]
MGDQAHENLIGLLQRFMDEPAARTAHKDIQAGERWLDAQPAPAPDALVIAALKTQMAVWALRRHRIRRLVHASVAAAAAVIVLSLIGLLGPRSTSRPHLSYAAIIPTAIWESDDITTDDLDLVYFSSEIRQIEAQVRALDADDSDNGVVGIPEEFETELMAIQTELWKG